MNPLVSVIMPVHNAADFLAEAVQSILRQTYPRFELLAINDGSTDATGLRLRNTHDPRLRIIEPPRHQGLVASLNLGCSQAKGKYLARMDADDWSAPDRFQRQVTFLETHPEVGICGGAYKEFGSRTGLVRLPVCHQQIHARMFFGHALGHPTVMFRRELFTTLGLRYDPSFTHAEDTDFFSRAAKVTRLANLPDVIHHYRVHPQQVGAKGAQTQRASATQVRLRTLLELLPDATAAEQDLHARILNWRITQGEMASAEAWLTRLIAANRIRQIYSTKAFLSEIRRCWYLLHNQAGEIGWRNLIGYWRSPLRDPAGITPVRHLILAFKSATRRRGSITHSPSREAPEAPHA